MRTQTWGKYAIYSPNDHTKIRKYAIYSPNDHTKIRKYAFIHLMIILK